MCGGFYSKTHYFKWDNVIKNGPSKTCMIYFFKNFFKKWYGPGKYKVRAYVQFFWKRAKKGQKRAKYLKIWAKTYKIWKYFEKGCLMHATIEYAIMVCLKIPYHFNFFKNVVLHKFNLVHSWVLCPIYRYTYVYKSKSLYKHANLSVAWLLKTRIKYSSVDFANNYKYVYNPWLCP